MKVVKGGSLGCKYGVLLVDLGHDIFSNTSYLSGRVQDAWKEDRQKKQRQKHWSESALRQEHNGFSSS